jgi:phosphoribosylanthranilate isomerase
MSGPAAAPDRLTMSTKVKICGVTNADDAELARSLGAWAVGLVFQPESPRRCGLDAAVEIGAALKRRAEVVGVFVNAPLEEAVATADAVGLTMIQLHGDEGPSYCQEVKRRTGLRVMKAMRVKDASSIRALGAYATDLHLLDAFVTGRAGGTGERFDWLLAGKHPRRPPLVLSGGLRAENVGEAIEVVRPFAVDVASGVEAEAGRKDPARLEAFFAAVNESTRAPV